MKELEARLARQVRLSKMLGLGFTFSIIPFVALKPLMIPALSSLLSLVTGLKAMSIIRKSEEEIDGMEMASWCIIMGAAGAVIFPLLFLLAQKVSQL